MLGRVAEERRERAISMTVAASGQPALAARTLARCCLWCASVASLAKRWLLGTHQGAVDAEHLPSSLNEFVFRFNRRRTRRRGVLFYRGLEFVVADAPMRYRDLALTKSPKAKRPKPPGKRGHPPSLERPRQDRPWREHNSG